MFTFNEAAIAAAIKIIASIWILANYFIALLEFIFGANINIPVYHDIHIFVVNHPSPVVKIWFGISYLNNILHNIVDCSPYPFELQP